MTSAPVRPAGGAFAFYLVAFFGAWAAYVLWPYPLVAGLGEGSFAEAAAGIGAPTTSSVSCCFTGGSVFTAWCETRTSQLQHVHDLF